MPSNPNSVETTPDTNDGWFKILLSKLRINQKVEPERPQNHYPHTRPGFGHGK